MALTPALSTAEECTGGPLKATFGKVGFTTHTLPLRRDLTVAGWASLIIGFLMVVMSAAGLAWGSTGLYGVGPNQALGVRASTAGVLVPGFQAQDVFNLGVGLPILIGRCGSLGAAP
jgi:hypothetical protein